MSLSTRDDLLADAAQLVEVVAEHLDGERAVRIEHLVEHAVDDRLAEGDLEARAAASSRADMRRIRSCLVSPAGQVL